MNYPPYHLSNRTRSIIFAVFTGVFLIAAPTLSLYTAGYRLNTGSFGISRIGVLSVDIIPKDATTLLNGKMVGTSLPLRLTNLTPGTYNLRIEKSGYLPLIKDIVIEQNKTTYIKDLSLFAPTNPDPVELNDTLRDIAWSFNGNFLVEKFQVGTSTKLTMFDTIQELTTPIETKHPDTEQNIFWSEKSNTVAILEQQTSSTNVMVLAGAAPLQKTSLKIFGHVSNWQWKQNFYKDMFVVRSGQLVYTFDTTKVSDPQTLSTTSSLWYVDNDDQDWFFDENSKSLIGEKENLYLGVSDVKKIVDINKNRAIVQTNAGLTIVVRDDKKEVKNISTTNFFYDDNRKEYIAWSPWELWTVYQDGHVTLLNRMSEAIVQVAALDETGQLLVVTSDKLLGFNPGYYLTQEILSGVHVEKAAVNEETRTIYFFGTWNQKKGLYKLKY